MTGNRVFLHVRYVLLLLFTLALASCSGAIGADDDGKPEDAKLFFQDVSVSDSLDENYSDKKDWRRVHFVQDVRATLTLVMAPAEHNGVTGRVAVYTSQIQLIGQRDIQPGLGEYELMFAADAGRDYYILVETQNGKADYRISLATEINDPCARCSPDEECRDGRCYSQSACRSCPDGKSCDEELAECVWNKCVGKRCKSSQSCDVRGRCVGGRVYKPQCRRDSDCSGQKICRRGRCVRSGPPPCPSGQKRVNGQCQTPSTPEQFSEVLASVVHVSDAGGGFVILELNKGSSRGLKRSMSGTIRGRSLKVISVDRFRSKGKVKGKVSGFQSGQKVLFRVPVKSD